MDLGLTCPSLDFHRDGRVHDRRGGRYGIAIPVGAIAILIMDVGIRRGFVPAVSAGAGAATADLLYAALAVVGGATLASTVKAIGNPLRVVSGLVLLVIGVIGLVRIRQPVDTEAME
ncbi:MAG: LysE family transporter, partial [Acidimicrobiia bacterium]